MQEIIEKVATVRCSCIETRADNNIQIILMINKQKKRQGRLITT